MNILVSACLMGVKCRYNGTDAYLENLQKLKGEHQLIPVCPEVLGGLPTPRVPAERSGDQVITRDGEDVTSTFQAGAREALKLAQQHGCQYAILKDRSPSCGYGRIYDGSFSSSLIDGKGITAELLMQNGVKVINESGIKAFLDGSFK